VFFLLGPRAYWPGWSARQFSSSGRVTNNVNSINLLSRRGLPFTVKARPHYVCSPGGKDRDDWYRWSDHEFDGVASVNTETNVQSLVMETPVRASEYSAQRFLADATGVAADLCLVVSFLSHGLVNWFSYSQADAGTVAGFHRPIVPPRSAEPSQLDEMVPLSESAVFLSRSFKALRKLRTNGIDLRPALTYAFAAGEVTVVSQKLGVLYLALEAALKAHPRRKQRQIAGFEGCKRDVLEAVHAYAEQRKKRRAVFNEKWWRQKVGDVSRPSFWQALEPLLRRYRVGWKDLYSLPGPARPTFIDVRNKLVHAGLSDDDEAFLKETLRLKAVVQRLLLRSLGWQDLWNVPDLATKYFLSDRRELPEGEDLRLLGGSHRRRTKRVRSRVRRRRAG